ncbi:DNA-binding MarR family transcriptional regulator [Microbacterium phyllosphaerae]|nr:DNA-binding MarR family transcriptional regulator [Microbacterium phyllosphaerae]
MVFQVPRMDERESEAWLGLIAVSQLLPAALDSQLQRDAQLTHFEFMVLTALRFAPENTLRMTELAASTNATLPRLSHVCSRLATRGIVDRFPSPEDGRATNVRLTAEGRRELIHAMPGHIDTARRLVIDALTPAQLESLAEIATAITGRLTDGEHRSPVPR